MRLTCNSITSRGDPGENAIAERINRTIKKEFNCRTFLTFEQAKTANAKSIQAYNNLCAQASCDYFTPNLAHQQQGLLKKRRRKYDRKKSVNKDQLYHFTFTTCRKADLKSNINPVGFKTYRVYVTCSMAACSCDLELADI
ncbi:MAG: family transposase [Adhaeribacter sp.]|jgi:hypothetical protein|nr:family transposase [Adhaeribacter sp.]